MGQFETNHTGDNQQHTAITPQAGGIAEKQHANGKGARRTYASPYRIGGAERDLLLRQPQQPTADSHAGNRQGYA